MPEFMSTLVALAVTVMIISLIFAILNFARSFRTQRDVRKAYHKALSKLYFGIFMIAFSIDQILLFPTFITYLIVAILIFLGIININYGYKASKYFKGNLPIENKAWEDMNRQKKREN